MECTTVPKTDQAFLAMTSPRMCWLRRSNQMTTMRAFRIHEFGGPEVIQPESVEIPTAGADMALIKVVAASLNPVDYKTRSGRYPLVKEDKLPYILGRDFAGRIVEVSKEQGGFAPGDAVYGFLGQEQGAFAEYVAVKQDALARKPDSLDFTTAAAVPLAGLTAWQGLFEHGGLAAGQKVLIHAAAGGVGHFAVQFARAHGATVYATASGDSVEFVKNLGADVVIDYKKQAFETVAKDVDVVFDLIGGETQERSWKIIKAGGALVSTVAEPSRARGEELHIRTARYTARPDGKQLAAIGRLIDDGKVKVHVSRTFLFKDTPEAERYLEAGHILGKVVLEAF
jgi:NADPH:quinone reductase-like Zn-dependent oxidoreductase